MDSCVTLEKILVRRLLRFYGLIVQCVFSLPKSSTWNASIHVSLSLQRILDFQPGYFWILFWRKWVFIQYKVRCFWTFHIREFRECFLCFHYVRTLLDDCKHTDIADFQWCNHQCRIHIWADFNIFSLACVGAGKNAGEHDLLGICFHYSRVDFQYWRSGSAIK